MKGFLTLEVEGHENFDRAWTVVYSWVWAGLSGCDLEVMAQTGCIGASSAGFGQYFLMHIPVICTESSVNSQGTNGP